MIQEQYKNNLKLISVYIFGSIIIDDISVSENIY